MSQAIQTYDLWRRDWIRLLVGFTLAGFGCALCIILLQNPGSNDRPEDRWIVYAVSSMGVVPGILIICLRRLVILDSMHRQLTRAIFLFYIPIHRRSWIFSALRGIEVRHKSCGDDGYTSMVGVVPLSGPVIWVRTFTSPASGPCEESLAFARELAITTGLHYEIHPKTMA